MLKYIAVVGGVECDAAAVVDDDVADFVVDCSIEKCNLLRNPCCTETKHHNPMNSGRKENIRIKRKHQ